MKRTTPLTRSFAARLISHEMRGSKHSDANAPVAAFRVCQKLQPPLAMLIGRTGFRALLTRALALAKTNASWLQAADVAPDGTLSMLGGLPTRISAGQIAEGSVGFIAELLELLIAFIGEQLTWRLMHDAWPQLPPPTFDLGRGSRHET